MRPRRCQKRFRLRMAWKTLRKVTECRFLESTLILSLERHGEESSGRSVPDQPGDKNWSTIVYGEKTTVKY